MLIKKALIDSWQDILSAWNQEMVNIHPLSERIFKEKILNCEQFISDLSYSLYLNKQYLGFIAIKKSLLETNKYKLYISLIYVSKKVRNHGYGGYMLNALFLFLEKIKYNEIIIGGDESCIFSGIFNKNNEFTHFFFKNRGFKVQSNNVNLVVNNSLDVLYENKHYQYILGINEEKKYEVLNLIRKNFSERWFNEISESDSCDLGVVIKDNSIIGFINTATIKSKKYPNSMNDYLLFKNLAGIGPLGIVPDLQGLGIGLFMVNKTLQELFKNGASDIMVDWTGFEYFYKKCGFSKIHEKYITYCYKMED